MTYLAGYSLAADAKYSTFPWCQEIDWPWLLRVVGVVYLNAKQ